MGRYYNILNLIFDFFRNSQQINLSTQRCILVVLAGKHYGGSIEDKRRLYVAKDLAKKLHLQSYQTDVVFLAYKEMEKEANQLMKKTFDKKVKWEIQAKKSFKIENSRTQILSLIKKYKDKANLVIVTDKWHRPRILRYLKKHNKFDWQVYAQNTRINLKQSIVEFYKILRYHDAGDLEL